MREPRVTAGPPAGPPEAKPWLLDTSAIFAFIQNEDGAERVEAALRQPTTLIPWPVLLEAHYITLRVEGAAEADRRYALLKELGVTLLWEVDEPLLLTAARLKAEHRLSLADCIIASYATRADAVLLHKDPEYESLDGLLSMEALPYKTSGAPA
jgi:predicted nucleic acid-binding protein